MVSMVLGRLAGSPMTHAVCGDACMVYCVRPAARVPMWGCVCAVCGDRLDDVCECTFMVYVGYLYAVCVMYV